MHYASKLSLLSIAVIALSTVGLPFAAAAETKDLCAQMANTPLVKAGPVSIEGAQSFIYKSVQGTDLRLHVFSPPGTSSDSVSRPALVFFFGGGWMIGTVTEFVPEARYFANRGVTTVVVDYRTFCRNGVNIVDEVADAKSAVRWVRGHAHQLGIDPHRIAVSGGSSGGHLALSTAMFSDLDDKTEKRSISSRPDLLVLFYPCVDETTAEEKEFSAQAIGIHGKDVSPLYHIRRGLPPTIIFQGTADSLYGENVKYCAAARSKGNDCRLIEYPGAPHGFLNRRVNGGRWSDQGLRDADEFLVQRHYLKASKSPHPRLDHIAGGRKHP